MSLRSRLTIVHIGLFLVASTIVVTFVYFANRAIILRLERAVTPRMYISEDGPKQLGEMVPRDQAWDEALAGLLWQSVLTFLLMGAVAGLLGWWLTGRALRRVDAAFAAQGRFIANASHELRTPLTVTRTLVQVGLSSSDPGRVQRAREELLRSNDRSIALINGLLHLARGEQELRTRERVRLDAVAERVASEITGPIDLRVAAVEVLGDELLLEQLVRNLLDNAVRYNAPGGTASVRVTPSGHWGRLTVENPGEVVTDADLLFEPFHRGARQRTGPDGAGLGLSIVRAVAVAHGGRVQAEARDGGGLIVTVEIPRSS
ncbi:HAMP domain-containing sensor histidine kinase [Lentzea sp. NPDC006480]|uniref:sensor histidine kinase n=1 Tax=Lentzea sp. NPDC006480 TaxID=3157176 RepID=UPI0033BC8968